MKLQLEENRLRWRVNEDELAQLLNMGSVSMASALGGTEGLLLSLHCCDQLQARLLISPQRWSLEIPRTALEAHVQRLPSRDALPLPLSDHAGLEVSFEVDVRDSLRQRGPRKRT